MRSIAPITLTGLAGLAGLALACEAATVEVKPAPVAAPIPLPAPAPPPVPVPRPPAEPPPTGPGDADDRAQRRQAALDLLSDGRSASALELIAAGPNHKFDPGLADTLTPKIIIQEIPGVRQRPSTVTGPLDKDIVRRVVRAHINEIRYCYNQGLAQDPELGGDVTIDFEILVTGRVGTATVRESTIPDAAVAVCIAKAVGRWTFPKPATVVQVSYPFTLSPRSRSP